MNIDIKTATLLLMVAILAAACNKTKTVSTRLIDAGEWTVTELSVDGTNEAELPGWHIKSCKIYEESCHGEWKNDEGGEAEFIWQFREKGKTLEISRQEGEEGHDHDHGHDHGHDHAAEEAIAQCYAFSGVYEVVEDGKENMEFKSTVTVGHAGKTVVLKIQKK